MLSLVVALVVSSTAAEALASAEEAFEAGRFEEVLPAARSVLERQASAAQRRRAYELQAMTYAAFDQGPRAVEAFRWVLGLDPGYEPGAGNSPKVRTYYLDARRQGPLPAAPHPALEPAPPLYRRWWFWVLVAGAAGTAGAVAVRAARSPQPTLGRWSFP